MEKNNTKTYWPHMILGFLFIGISLGYWTVKSAMNMPVQEVNKYMMKYQNADMSINDILERKYAFDKMYNIKLNNAQMMVMTDNIHSNKPQPDVVKLSLGKNNFTYVVLTKSGQVVNDANVSFLLTRPHTREDDVMIDSVPFNNGSYTTQTLEIEHVGRYTLQFRAVIGEKIGYSEIPAYLKF
jgi:nitrogen fixation protein FixH